MSNVFESSGYGEYSRGWPRIPEWVGSTYFATCCAVIGMISCYDMMLVFVHRETILHMEQNPICLALLRMEPKCFSLFVLAKTIGTLTVLAILVKLFRSQFHSSHSVTSSITLFQLGLLAYLTFA